MLVRQMLEIYDLLDTPQASGEAVAALLRERGAQDVTVTVVGGDQGTIGHRRAARRYWCTP